MELITSLILLAILLVPPLWLAGREIMAGLSSIIAGGRQAAGAPSGKDTDADTAAAAVYDGMITIEIPVSDPQVVAYEVPPQIEGDGEFEIIHPPSRASGV